MEVDPAERHAVLVERVELGLLGPPVEVGPPVLDEAPDVGEVRAVLPLGAGYLVRPARTLEPGAQVVESLLGDVESERLGRQSSTTSSPTEI